MNVLLLPTREDTQEWSDAPDMAHLPHDIQAKVRNRTDAINAVAGGKSIAAAAKLYGVNRTTLSKALHDAMTLGADGKPAGWRACIPHRCRQSRKPAPQALPMSGGPGAFARLLAALPALVALLLGYTKALPTRQRHSPSFEKFMAAFLKCIRDSGHTGYPLNVGDQGRRSVIDYIKKLRRGEPQQESGENAQEVADAKQLKQIFQFSVMERLEFDAHRMDADFFLEVEDTAGVTTHRKISYVWLLLLIDSVSRLVISWSLVVGRGYSQVDVLRVFMRALVPWEARDLLSEDMHYVPNTGIGTLPATGQLTRGVMSAADNALAHHSHLTTSNLTQHFKGVLSLARAHVPETRGLLEAMFKQLEAGAIRHIPGGFVPARDRDTPQRAATEDTAQTHPLNLVALHDLMDVILAGFNGTPLAALGDRSPLEVVRAHSDSGAWSFGSSRNYDDALALSIMRVTVTIRANRKKRRQPFVNFLGARYRSPGLMDRWDLVGQSFTAVTTFEDLRYLTLLDPNGEVFARLIALAPWGQTRHDLDLRKLIKRWTHRKLFSIAGVDDAVHAYRKFVRRNAAKFPAAADQAARQGIRPGEKAPRSRPDSTPMIIPRDGAFSFDQLKGGRK